MDRVVNCQKPHVNRLRFAFFGERSVKIMDSYESNAKDGDSK